MPKHIVRLIILMAAGLAVALAAKWYFTPESFYLYGHYRGDSVAEIASDKPRYKGAEYCQACHAERYAEWSQGAHRIAAAGEGVQCEACHGPAGGRDTRAIFEHSATGVDHPASGKLAVPADTVKLCTLCHEKMPGRPAEQPQIVVATHAGTQQCKVCHDPHSPGIAATAAPAGMPAGDAAAGKVKAASCVACHGADGVSSNPAWPNLAGQKEAYLVDSLKAYEAGARDEPVMAGIAKALSDADVANLAAYYAGLPCKDVASEPGRPAALAVPAKASGCAACHGAAGVSANPMWPDLAGQPKEYLVIATQAYKSGARKHAMMAGIARDLSDADVENLAAYYASAGCK
jgi:cytochrome c553